MDIHSMQTTIDTFAEERDWDQFHSPKNLVMALSVEVGELVEHFQWMTEDQSLEIASDNEAKARIEQEIADTFIYLLRLCSKLDVDIESATYDKLKLNAEKYPVSLSKGNAIKYDKR